MNISLRADFRNDKILDCRVHWNSLPVLWNTQAYYVICLPALHYK